MRSSSTARSAVIAAVAALGCVALSNAGLAQAQPRGEEWEYALSLDMEGMKMPLPPSRVCVRPDEGHTPQVDKHCTLKDRKVSGSTTTFHIVCGPPEPGEIKGEFTRKGDRVEGRYTLKQGGDTMTVIANGRRLGACDPTEPGVPTARK
jgi:hypothetical protein